MLHPNKSINDIFYTICLIVIGPIGWAILFIILLIKLFVPESPDEEQKGDPPT